MFRNGFSCIWIFIFINVFSLIQMGRKRRSTAWINARKAINDKINNQSWWEKHFGQEYSKAKIQMDINALPDECETHLSLDDVFDINHLLSVLIDEQILFYVNCSNLKLEKDVVEWIKYNDYNLKRRMDRKVRNVSVQIRTISLNVAG